MLEKERNMSNIENDARRSRKRTKSEGLRYLYLVIIILGLILISYMYKASTYKKRFFPNTILNGIDISEKTARNVEELINSKAKEYSLHLKTRDGEEEISGESVGLRIDARTEIEDLLKKQNIYTWIKHINSKSEFNADTLVELNDSDFENVVSKLKALDEKNFVEPISAKISSYVSGKGYDIEPEVKGTKVDIERAKAGIKEALSELLYEYDFDKEGLYEEAKITSDNVDLVKTLEKMNTYVNSSVSYSKLPVLTGDTINKWIVYNEDGSVNLDETKINAYVKEVANAYNTVGKSRKFKTSYGGAVVNVPAGNYGWKISEAREVEAIKEAIRKGENITREPEFEKKAASLTGDDFGNSYVEVNLSAQQLFLYKDGKKVLESDFVSGNVSKNHTTPPGIFSLTYKQKDAVLKGQDYAAPVSYWMPFNRNIGFHDAKWRSKFGGDIYKTSGSHGCINMPPSNAKILFENINTGFPVICYNMEGTARKTSSTNINQAAQTTATQAGAADTALETTNETKKVEKATTQGPNNPTETTKGPSVPTAPTKGPGTTTEAIEIVPARP